MTLSHPWANYEIQRYYQNEPKDDDVYSRNNLPIVKDDAYVINLNEYVNIRTHSVSIYVKDDQVMYCDCYGIEHVPKRNWKTSVIKI